MIVDRPLPPRHVATSDYRRSARRVRARLADQPEKMHRALRRLAQDQNAAAGPGQADISGRFTQCVADALEAGVLRYSRRRTLLSQAERWGLGRFQANLLIAMVQHRHRAVAAPPVQRHRPRRWMFNTLGALLIQSGLLLAGLWVLS